MAARIPRRPEVPGAPGLKLPKRQQSLGIGRLSEELLPPIWEEDEPTNPFPTRPPASGTAPTGTRSGSATTGQHQVLSVPNLTKDDAVELQGIIAAWESSDPGGRTLLAEFAKRLARTREK